MNLDKRTCPACGAGLPTAAVLCVTCGLNLRTGQKLTTARPSDSVSSPAVPSPLNKLKGVSPSARKWYEAEIAKPPARVLKCDHCGQEFWINCDSTIVSGSEVMSDLQTSDSHVIYQFDESLADQSIPDTVGEENFEALSNEAAAAKRQMNCETLRLAAYDFTRQWTCYPCKKVNTYGSPREFTLDVPLDDLLDAQIAVFRAMIEEATRSVPSELKKDISIYIRFQNHGPPLWVCEKLSNLGTIYQASAIKNLDGELLFDVKNVVWISRNVCQAAGGQKFAIRTYRVVRDVRSWKAQEW